MPRFLFRMSVLVMTLPLSLSAFDTATAEEVEHPIYRSWAKHPIGTTITLRSVTISGGHTIVTTNRTRLVKLTASAAELETTMTSDGTGKVVESPPQTYSQRRMFPLFAGMTKDDIGKPPKTSKNGEETLKLVGKEIKTRWFDSTGQTEVGKSSTRTWMSDDVPGKLVKAVTQVPAAKNSTTVELIEFMIPDKNATQNLQRLSPRYRGLFVRRKTGSSHSPLVFGRRAKTNDQGTAPIVVPGFL